MSAYYQAVLDVGHRLLWAFAVALGRSRYVLQARNQDAEPVAPHPLPVVAFVATSHRVRKVSEERYSFPLFFNVDYHTEVKPLPQFASREGERRPALRAGEDLFAQTGQTFGYLRHRVESGSLTLPDGSLETGQFGQQALQKRS